MLPLQRTILDDLRQIASRVDDQWRKRDYDSLAFTEIAESFLRDDTAFNGSDFTGALLRELISERHRPSQLDPESTFADPPVTVVHAGRFVLDVYFWLDGTPAIHQHGFSGAFRVAAGSSLHTTFEFREQDRCNQHLRFGELRRIKSQLLETGAVQPIRPGDALIHALFHLDRPSVSVVLRTLGEPSARPQFNYLAPSIAYNPEAPTDLHERGVELVIMAFLLLRPDRLDLARAYGARVDTHSRFVLLRRAQERLPQPEFDALLSCMCEDDERLARYGRGAFAERARQINLTVRRKDIVSPNHRLFLALALNVDCWEDIRDLVQQRFPAASAEDTICEWVSTLGAPTADPKDNAIGVRMDASAMEVFRLLLRGASDAQAVEALRKKYGESAIEPQTELINEVCQSFRTSPVFAPLFRRKDHESG